MTLQELSCFLEVGKVLNFSKAAEKLYISQPAVSKYIRRLEEELEVRLLERSVRREVTLTEAGRILLESLKQCEDVFAQGMEQLSLLKGSGSVTVSLTEDCNLPDLMMQHPVFQRTDHPKLSEFAEYPLFLSRTLPGRMVEFFEEVAGRTMGYEPKQKQGRL